METPKGTSDKDAFEEGRATSAVPTFRRGTRVGEVVSLAALGGGMGVEEEDQAGEEGEEGKRRTQREWKAGRGGLPRECAFSLVFSLVRFSSLPFFSFGEQGIRRTGSPTMVAGHRMALREIIGGDGIRSCYGDQLPP